MSFLDLPRLSFLGTFKASPSTVNNTPINFYAYEQPEAFYNPASSPPNNLAAFSVPASFPASIQDIWGSLNNSVGTGVSWNPNGLALFSFDGKIQSATFDATKPVAGCNALIGASITTVVAGQKFPAKLVDLDPDQQTVTGLYGLGMTLQLPDGTGFVATISDAAMQAGKVPTLDDLWFFRVPSKRGDAGASSNIQWVFDKITALGAVSSSGGSSPPLVRFLTHCQHGISVRITVDSFHDGADLQSKQAFFGRIVGTLGPAGKDEPYSFVAGRRVVPTNPQPGPQQYWPVSAVLKPDVLTLDLANVCPLNDDLTPIGEPRPMVVHYQEASGAFVPLKNGTLDYSKAYYEKFAGVNDVILSRDEFQKLAHRPIAIVVGNQPVLEEDAQGRFIMPEQWSLRLSPGENTTVRFWTLKFGQPDALEFSLVGLPTVTIAGSNNETLDALNVPDSALSWTTEPDPHLAGVARVTFTAAADLPAGQLPLIRQWVGSALFSVSSPSDPLSNWMQWGAVLVMQQGISVLVWCNAPDQAVIDNPKFEDIREIMQGYAALYPGMVGILDIGSPSVLNDPIKAQGIYQMMNLPTTDPGSMPVTRDLSPADRRMVLNYLQKIIKGGGPGI